MTFNLFLILVAAIGAFLGFQKGILRQVGSIVGVVLGIIACRLFATPVASMLSSDESDAFTIIGSYAVIFAAVYLIAIVVAYTMRKIVRSVNLGFIDRIGGAIFNILKYCFMLSLVLNVWVAIVPDHAPESVWGDRIMAFAPAILGTETASELWACMQ